MALALLLAAVAPGFFARDNLADLFLANVPVLIIALGMTLIVLTGHIDISVGSMFACCAVASGVLAKAGVPMPLVLVASCALGAGFGFLNGALVARVRIPSIVVTLATMIALREGLRWATEGAWIQDLPADYQWLGVGARGLSVARPDRGRRPAGGIRLGAAQAARRPGDLRNRLEPAGRAARRHSRRGGDDGGVHGGGGAGRDWPRC